MSPTTSSTLYEAFAKQLRQRRTEVLAQLRAQRGGPMGRAEAAAEARESAELVAIDTALQRVAAGSYGLCTDCGTGIAAARLHANPTALRCLDCQEKAERLDGGTAMPSL